MNHAGRSRVGSTLQIRKLYLLGAMVASVAPFFVTPTPATATPIDYTLSDATATFGSPSNTIMLTGTFTFDPSGLATLDAVDISISGSTSVLPGAPETFNVANPAGTALNEFQACVGPCTVGATAVALIFTNNLTQAPDPLERILIGTLNGNGADFENVQQSTGTTGDAQPTTTPEPASLTLLGGALALFLFARRAKQRGRRA